MCKKYLVESMNIIYNYVSYNTVIYKGGRKFWAQDKKKNRKENNGALN